MATSTWTERATDRGLLARASSPDHTKHNCIGIRQGEEAYGVWCLARGRGRSAITECVKTRGNLTTNDDEIAVNWALEGHGILMRRRMDIDRYLKNGRFVQVLPQYSTAGAAIHAVYPGISWRARTGFRGLVASSFNQQAAAGK